MWRRSSFQTRAAATGKAWSPTVDNRVRRTISDDDDAERRPSRASRSEDRWNSSASYGGAVLANVRTARLYSILSRTFSQCSRVEKRRDWVVLRWQEHQPGSRVHRWLEPLYNRMPDSVALPQSSRDRTKDAISDCRTWNGSVNSSDLTQHGKAGCHMRCCGDVGVNVDSGVTNATRLA